MARRLIRATPALAEIETNLRRQEQVDQEIARVFAAPELRLRQFDRAANHAALQFTRHRLKETRLHDLARITGTYGSERGQPPPAKTPLCEMP